VAARTNGDEQVSRSGEHDGGSDIVGIGTIDHGRRSAIDHTVPHFPRLVVARIVGHDQFATKGLPQMREVRPLQRPLGVPFVRKPERIHRVSLLDRARSQGEHWASGGKVS
jgi:hypothetical protein